MIIIYNTIPDKEMRQEATETIPRLVKWFKNHPSRHECVTKVWYGEFITIKRGTRASIAKAIHAAVEAAINQK